MKDLKTIQVLASISLIGAPVSLIFSSLFLSIAAFVCGIVAMVMLNKREADPSGSREDEIAEGLKRQAIIGIAISAVALALNAVALAAVLPAMIEAMRTGDYSALFAPASDTSATGAFDSTPNASESEAGDASGRSSAWG